MKQVKAIEISGCVVKMIQTNDIYQVVMTSPRGKVETKQTKDFSEASCDFDNILASFNN